MTGPVLFIILAYVGLLLLWWNSYEGIRDAGGSIQNGTFVPWGDRLWKGYTQWPYDKTKHTLSSLVLVLIAHWVFRMSWDLSAFAVFGLGIMVEVCEWAPRKNYPGNRQFGHFSWKDLVADLIGVALAEFVIWAL